MKEKKEPSVNPSGFTDGIKGGELPLLLYAIHDIDRCNIRVATVNSPPGFNHSVRRERETKGNCVPNQDTVAEGNMPLSPVDPVPVHQPEARPKAFMVAHQNAFLSD